MRIPAGSDDDREPRSLSAQRRPNIATEAEAYLHADEALRGALVAMLAWFDNRATRRDVLAILSAAGAGAERALTRAWVWLDEKRDAA